MSFATWELIETDLVCYSLSGPNLRSDASKKVQALVWKELTEELASKVGGLQGLI